MSNKVQVLSPSSFTSDGRRQVVIENIQPSVDAGRYPVKRVVGDKLEVGADIYADGHDHISAVVAYRVRGEEDFAEAPLRPQGNDVWRGSFTVEQLGRYEFRVSAWIDHFDTWIDGLQKKVEVDAETEVDLLIGSSLFADASGRAGAAGDSRAASELKTAARLLKDDSLSLRDRSGVALAESIIATARRFPDRSLETVDTHWYQVVVDPVQAQFSSWYELFPRSLYGETDLSHGTLKTAEERLGYIADMGFDVVYLPPIHPIGTAFRKGPNNALVARDGDPGSPWAIGSSDGGHTAVHPDLGTVDDLVSFVSAAGKRSVSVALDIAFQCSPDHPWVSEHEEWFVKRPDGTIQYAENPPKKYQDIYPINFESEDWENLWVALRDVFLFWIDKGVTIFRVDNPHTKSFPFWEWCIDSIKAQHPQALFLAEAFTRPRRMYGLAKKGFSQSYTYFTWRTTADELRDYMIELTQTNVVEFFRPNFWPNTPDILHEFLQQGGRSAFLIRHVLAATLTANYGIYGPAYELLENAPRDPGSEEYLDSEKYQVRTWDTDSPSSIRPFIATVNQIRHDNPALQQNRDLRFHSTDNPNLLAYSKRQGDNIILVVVNLSWEHTHGGNVEFSPAAVMLPDSRPFRVTDLFSGESFTWEEYWNFVSLDPFANPAHIFRLETEGLS
jgi:starch synthase (maltosyl-transferring)